MNTDFSEELFVEAPIPQGSQGSHISVTQSLWDKNSIYLYMDNGAHLNKDKVLQLVDMLMSAVLYLDENDG